MWEVYRDMKFIREFDDKKAAHKFKEDCMNNDLKNKDMGHRYRVEKKNNHTIEGLVRE